MSSITFHTWTALNQRYLDVALAGLRRRLERADGDDGTDAALRALADEMRAPPALETVRQTFGLSNFERDVLLLCAGPTLDADFAKAVASAGGPGVSLPTFGLALATLADPHWSALSPAGPLRRWRLIEMQEGPTLTGSPLRIDERVLHHLTGVQYLDEGLTGIVETDERDAALAASHEAIAAAIVRAWTGDGDWPTPALVQLVATEAEGARAIAARAAARLERQLAVLRAGDIPASAREREELLRLWEREAALGSRALLVDCLDRDAVPGDERPVAQFLGRVASPVLALVRRKLAVRGRQGVQFAVVPPNRRERQALWGAALTGRAINVNGYLPAIAQQFALDAEDIRAIADELALGAGAAAPDDAERHLWDLCRDRTRPRLDGLAQWIEPSSGWDDLVLPPAQNQILRSIALHVRQRGRVYGEWGFARKGRRGLGVSALFSGPSGTGKTMAAEVLAAELRLDLYRIDLSQVVSKYIGETEKNLGKLFDAAEGGGVVLLFDEADALFGKRSEVRDSHDRYANIEVSYLLQRMETYDGLAILTTNLKGALDPAFMRRIRFAMQFPFPDGEARAAIWRRIYPAETPLDGLDADKLARLNVAGGNIRNIALNAAFIAADGNEPVGMRHLLQAARAEASKLERPLSDAEIRGWL